MITARAVKAPDAPAKPWDVDRIREDFPALHQPVHGKPLVYLDNAATSQKPRAVLDALVAYYTRDNANVHRGVHLLSERATEAYEGSRARIQRHLNAASAREIVFVRQATEGINLVAASFGRAFVAAGDEIVISAIEHHANIVPWQMLCEEKQAFLRVVPVDDRGDLIMEEYARLLGPRTRLVAITQVSNALGTVTPIKEIIGLAHRHEIPVLVDGAQAVPHLAVDVQDLDCDFYVFSGHKTFGPTGIGVLYGKETWLDRMPPYQGGGDMIKAVTFEKTVYNDLPYKFEAGTPHIAGAVGLATALEYVAGLGLDRIGAWEHELLVYGAELLTAVPGLRFIGTPRRPAAVLSFVLDDIHAHDVGTILDHQGVAVRTGHHCAMPVMQRFEVPATVRASLAFYNTPAELETLAGAVRQVREIFG
jgi:cysteine desulfurase / selenocysteine lyase